MDWRFYQIIAWGTVSISSISFLLHGVPFPRPWYVFIGAGIALVALLYHVYDRNERMNKSEIYLTYTSAIFVGLYLRLSQWIRATVAGSDMIAHYMGRAGYIIETGHVNSELGMYSHTPLIHIFVAINKLSLGIPIYDIRLVAVALSASVPLIVAIVGRCVGGESTGLYSIILATTFPLFFRVGAMFDAESLAIPFFVTMIFLLYRINYSQSQRFTILLVTLMLISSFIHFLYPIIIVGTVVSGIWIINILSATSLERFSLGKDRRMPILATGIIFAFLFYRILYTDVGARMFIGLGITGADVGSSLLSDISIIPSGGAVGRTIQGGGGSGGNRLLNIVLPLGIFITLGVVGGIRAIYERSNRKLILLSIASVLGFGVLIGLGAYTSRSSFRLGYRLYYFAGIIGLIFAGVGLAWLSESLLPTLQSVQPFLAKAVLVLIVAAVLSFGVLAPMSSIGNSTDPYFGGQSIAITDIEYQQLSSLSDKLNRPVSEIQVPGLAFPGGDSDDRSDRAILPRRATDSGEYFLVLTTTNDRCITSNSVWVTNRYRLCT
jgi:hypothetical protein